MLGSWDVKVVVGSLPEKVATAVGELGEKLIGAEYTPIAYLGSQLVNGTNHAVLAEQVLTTGRDTKNIVVLTFNEKEDKLTLIGVDRVVESGEGMGATVVDVKTEIPADAKAVFDEAFAGFCGSDVKPFALLATQVVNGTDYIFACEVTSVTKEPVTSVAIVTVNGISKTAKFEDLIKGTSTAKALGYAFTWLKNKGLLEGNAASIAANLSGGWKVNVVLDGMPQKVATAFGKLEDLVGATYTPIAYLGEQVVNGTNHAVLAEQTLVLAEPVKNIVVIIFNEAPGAGPDDLTIVSIKTLVEGGNGFGATVIDVETGENINKTAQKLFEQRFGGFCGSVVTPFALLGTQVVRGTNFIFACESTPVLADNDGSYKKAVLVIMNDLSDDVQFVDILQPEINRSLGAPLGEWP